MLSLHSYSISSGSATIQRMPPMNGGYLGGGSVITREIHPKAKYWFHRPLGAGCWMILLHERTLSRSLIVPFQPLPSYCEPGSMRHAREWCTDQFRFCLNLVVGTATSITNSFLDQYLGASRDGLAPLPFVSFQRNNHL
jgi:hypothetical protein